MPPRTRIAILLASLADGGVGKMRTRLANAFVEHGYQVDVLLGKSDSPYSRLLDRSVRVIDIGTTNAITGVPRLAFYLHRERPSMLLTQRIRVNVLALRARRLSRVRVPVFVTANTHMSTQFASMVPAKQHQQMALLRRYYPRNDGIIAISRGVATDLAGLLGWPVEQIPVVYNPVVSPDMDRLAQASPEHPWLNSRESPVVLAMGRLEPQKDFPTLLRAFRRVRERQVARLIILGEGKEREPLHRLSEQLGIAADVDMPGFQPNPYAYLARADLFAFSSAWEGFGNALAESLSLGTPVVATDCPSGPSEILDDGRYGPLVPVGDDAALAEAILATLANPLTPETLKAGAARFTVERSAEAYLRAMGLASSA